MIIKNVEEMENQNFIPYRSQRRILMYVIDHGKRSTAQWIYIHKASFCSTVSIANNVLGE